MDKCCNSCMTQELKCEVFSGIRRPLSCMPDTFYCSRFIPKPLKPELPDKHVEDEIFLLTNGQASTLKSLMKKQNAIIDYLKAKEAE